MMSLCTEPWRAQTEFDVKPASGRACGLYHKSFGQGEILSATETMVQIDFKDVGVKKLSIEACKANNYLRLEPLSSAKQS